MMRGNLSEWAVNHRQLVVFLMVALLLGGGFSYSRLGRLEDPNFTVPAMTAVVVWPGATAREVQDQVLDRIEKKLQEVEGFDYVRSFARQGYGGMNIWVKGGTPGPKIEDAWYQMRKKVGDIRNELPAGVIGPFFNDEFGDTYSLLYALGGEGYSPAELNAHAEAIKTAFLRVPSVKKVDIRGKQAERVHVEFSHKRLAALGLPPEAIFDALRRQNALTPAGSVDTRSDRVFVRVDGALQGVDDLRRVPIEAGGRLLRLDDVATVTAGYEDPPAYTIRHNGAPVLVLGIVMSNDGNTLKLGEAMAAAAAEAEAALPAGLTLTRIADQPRVVKESVDEFTKSFLEALAIVLLVSFVSLGFRTGIVVAASVPLVLAAVAVLMYIMGWNLERISLGSLIIALGLLVDDAIIAVEMMVVKMEQGWDRMRAATFAYTSTAFPMLTGTLVTVAGFMPVGFAKSVAGEYAGGIFWIVGAALLASWLVAVVFTPYLGTVLLPAPRPHQGAAPDPWDRPVYRRLRRAVAWCLDHRLPVIAATVLALGAAGAGMTQVQQQFFPSASRPELTVELRLREGSAIEATTREVKRFEEVLARDPDVKHYTAYTGGGAARFYLSYSPELPNPGYAIFVIMTDGIAARERLRERLMELFDKDEQFPAVRGRVLRLEFGPPVGFPVQFRVVGPDTERVREIAFQARDLARQSPLVRDVQLDWNEQARAVRVRVDQDKARLLGLSTAEISGVVQTVLAGLPVTQLRRGTELVDVVARAVPEERLDLAALSGVNLHTRSGATVPLAQVATISWELEDPVLWRRNREMAITVRADLADGVQGPHATQQIMPLLKPVIDKLPAGYRIDPGGAIEESAKANAAIFAVFPAMFLVMLLILMIQLQDMSRALLVFLTAPLGLIGVVPALLAFNAPFGFVALLGVIALGGMIMRNSVILVDQIGQDLASGHAPRDAIIDATVRRARPVVLTAAAAVLAMIPLTHSVFWGPMAIAIMGGLVVATGLTLLVVPALYAAFFRVGRTAPAAAPLAAGA